MHATELFAGVCLGLCWSAVLGVCVLLKEPAAPLVVLQDILDRAGGLDNGQGELSSSEIAVNGWKFQALRDMEHLHAVCDTGGRLSCVCTCV